MSVSPGSPVVASWLSRLSGDKRNGLIQVPFQITTYPWVLDSVRAFYASWVKSTFPLRVFQSQGLGFLGIRLPGAGPLGWAAWCEAHTPLLREPLQLWSSSQFVGRPPKGMGLDSDSTPPTHLMWLLIIFSCRSSYPQSWSCAALHKQVFILVYLQDRGELTRSFFSLPSY